MSTCPHPDLIIQPCEAAKDVGYIRPERLLAAKSFNKCTKFAAGGEERYAKKIQHTFPGPLVLPGDSLHLDPDPMARQSATSWSKLVASQDVPGQRRKLYVVAPPIVSKPVSFMRQWAAPVVRGKSSKIHQPKLETILEYIEAFYSGFDVVLLPRSTLTFSNWDGVKSSAPDFVALNSKTESVRIRARQGHDEHYSRQLNSNDLLDVASSILPDDALALIMIVHHDIYEDDDDDFICGRAYGADHICIVSTARYNPFLDEVQGIDRGHSWPASHCTKFVHEMCKSASQGPAKKKIRIANIKPSGSVVNDEEPESGSRQPTPLQAALSAHRALDLDSANYLNSVYLSRVCRTAVHELGHCLGIDHCMYYSCIMQGSATIKEDHRQPPYLCPVDRSKVSSLVYRRGSKGSIMYRKGSKEIEVNNFRADTDRDMLEFCKKYENGGGFDAFRAWLEVKIAEEAAEEAASKV